MPTGDPWCVMRQTWCDCYSRGALPCPSLRQHFVTTYGDRTSAPLTEQRVREIVREEIERAARTGDAP